MSVLTLRVNDQESTARSGQTILSAAREAGIAIPTLCQFDGLSDVGACRLCLVEVSGTPKLLASCVTQAAEGMQVYTDTEKLRDYRRMIVEPLLAERNQVWSVCEANGHCELQDLAAASDVDHVGFEYQFPLLPMDVSHERFAIDHNRCILCTRCVRTCDEIEGAHTWDVDGRGNNSRVITDMAQPWGEAATCTSCGKCVAACPTEALFRQGSTVAESAHDRGRLAFLITAREKKQWAFWGWPRSGSAAAPAVICPFSTWTSG